MYYKNKSESFREKIVKVWICYYLFVCISTEILSSFNILNRLILAIVYCVTGLCLLFVFRKKIFRLKIKIALPKYWIWYLLLFEIIFLPLLLIALYYPPNNYDSLTYHLSRVEHWIQNNNVNFYTTNNDRQLFMPPLTEYVILHWRLLAGGDNLVNLVQYVAMSLSVVLSTLLVKNWNGKKISEVLTAILVSSIPMGIMQSTSTQTDYVTAFFVLATIYFCTRNNMFFLAIVVGLGIFTKSTYIIFVLPFGLYWFIKLIKNNGLKIWKKIVLILIITLLINSPHWHRNYQKFGSIFGSKNASEIMFNQSVEPKYVISNIVRNIGVQIGLPNKNYNLKIDSLVENIHNKLGIKTDDFINTFNFEKYKTSFSIHEDFSGNFLILILFVTTGIILVLKKYSVWPIYLSIFAGWLLFNILFKWQPWHSRLELPFFVAICPIIAITLTRLIKNELLIKILIVIVFYLSWPFVLGYTPTDKNNLDVEYVSNRPLKSDVLTFEKTRYERFIIEDLTNLYYSEIAKKIKNINAKNIAIDLGGESPEYSMWAALRYEKLDVKIHYLNEEIKNSDALIYDEMATNKNKYDTDLINVANFGGIKLSTF